MRQQSEHGVLAHLELAKLLKKEDKFEEAKQQCLLAIGSDPDKSEAYWFLGEIYEAQNLIPEALKYYHKAIDLQPHNWRFLFNLGKLFERQGCIDEAISSYLSAIEKNPSYSWSYYNLSSIFFAQEQWEKAVTFLRRGISFHPEEKRYWFNMKLADALMMQKAYSLAIHHYEQAANLDPLNVEVYRKVALCYFETQDYEQSISYLIKSLQINPDYVPAFKDLEFLFRCQGRWDEAKQCERHTLPVEVLRKALNLENNESYNCLSSNHQDVRKNEVVPAAKIQLVQATTLEGFVDISFQSRNINIPAATLSVVENARGWLSGSTTVVGTQDGKLLTDLSYGNIELVYHSKLLGLQEVKEINSTIFLLTTPGATRIYYHWMIDCIPRIYLLQKYGIELSKVEKFVVNRLQLNFQFETFSRLGIPTSKVLEGNLDPCIQAQYLIVPSLPRQGANLGAWIPSFLKSIFLDKTTSQSCSLPKRIYITRKGASRRKVLNEADVEILLAKFGFQSVILESMSIAEQAHLFSKAEAIVSPHGAGLTNIVFCEKGTKVIEFFSKHIKNYYWLLSNQCNLDYYSLYFSNHSDESRERSSSASESFEAVNFANIYVDLAQLSKMLKLAGLEL